MSDDDYSDRRESGAGFNESEYFGDNNDLPQDDIMDEPVPFDDCEDAIRNDEEEEEEKGMELDDEDMTAGADTGTTNNKKVNKAADDSNEPIATRKRPRSTTAKSAKKTAVGVQRKKRKLNIQSNKKAGCK